MFLPRSRTLTLSPHVRARVSSTAAYFDRSPETNEVLWFAAPPMHAARPPPVRHSMAYLAWLAGKRKARETSEAGMDVDGAGKGDIKGEDGEGTGEGGDAMDADGGDTVQGPRQTQRRGGGVPTVSEMMCAAAAAVVAESGGSA